MPSCRGGGVTVNSFQMNSVHLTEAGTGTVERCLDSRGSGPMTQTGVTASRPFVPVAEGGGRIDSETGATEMEVSRGLSDAVYVDVATGNMIHENTVGSIRFRTDSTGTVLERLI